MEKESQTDRQLYVSAVVVIVVVAACPFAKLKKVREENLVGVASHRTPSRNGEICSRSLEGWKKVESEKSCRITPNAITLHFVVPRYLLAS